MSTKSVAFTVHARDTPECIFWLKPLRYIHVLDLNTNISRVVVGPKTFTRESHERVTVGPDPMIVIPPHHYCIISNPVVRDDQGRVVCDTYGQAKLQHADEEVRLSGGDPFPLYPGEEVKQAVTPLLVVKPNSAIRLQALVDFTDTDGTQRLVGDEWLFQGPGSYIPRKEVQQKETLQAVTLQANQAVKLMARRECTDVNGHPRVAGEMWVVNTTGAYMPQAYESVVEVINGYVLTEKKSLHLRAAKTFTDDYGIHRKHGEEWLIKLSHTDTHIPHIYEEVLGIQNITTLTSRQWCIILDPADENGHPQLGKKKLVKGETSFFLEPGESLENGIQTVFILPEEEGVVVRAQEKFKDGDKLRLPGQTWLVRGPIEYIPPIEAKVVEKRRAICMDRNEGVYVRDRTSGNVRAVIGQTYMLTENEYLWEKELPYIVEVLLWAYKTGVQLVPGSAFPGDVRVPPNAREKTKVVTLKVPHNTAVQVYDYMEKKARVVYGPGLVVLGPKEQFTQLSLSGGYPKTPNQIKGLLLMLGPDFFADTCKVETSDHACLQLHLAYNWHFDIKDKSDETEAAGLFSVPDFIGNACNIIASNIRAAVAAVKFDDFHRNSSRIIRSSVFGIDANNKVKDKFVFPANKLVITSIDIQGVEPIDQKTKDSLQKSVTMAIEITSKSQEAAARHEAERLEQVARSALARQGLDDEVEAEKARRELLELQALSSAVESTGQAVAEAQSQAEAARIEGEAAVEQAILKAQANKIESEAELEATVKSRESLMSYQREQHTTEVSKARRLAEIECNKFRDMVQSIGANTIKSIATSGPELQVKLLQSIGLETTLITDGTTPINLFNTAEGLVGSALTGTAK